MGSVANMVKGASPRRAALSAVSVAAHAAAAAAPATPLPFQIKTQKQTKNKARAPAGPPPPLPRQAGLSWMAAGSTRSVFHLSFARDNNIADITAKSTRRGGGERGGRGFWGAERGRLLRC